MVTNAVRYYFGLIEYVTMSAKYKFLFLSIAFLLLAAATAHAQISPATATLGPSQQQQFTLLTQQQPGMPTAGQSARWAVVPADYGSITASGLFTAASTIPVAGTATVYVQSGPILTRRKCS